MHKSCHLSFTQLELTRRIAMATQPRWYCSFGLALVAALLVPRAHVPPALWQGGRRRPHIASEDVELLSPLAPLLMPKMPVHEFFRSFPSSDGEDELEPSLTAYGVMKDPQAALFIHFSGKYEKKGGLDDEFRKRLLAYGPPGSHILHISDTKSNPLEDMVLCIKVGEWQNGDEASLAVVLNYIRKQVSHGLKQQLCPDVLERFHSQNVFLLTSEMHDLRVACRSGTVNHKSLDYQFYTRGSAQPALAAC